MLTHLH